MRSMETRQEYSRARHAATAFGIAIMLSIWLCEPALSQSEHKIKVQGFERSTVTRAEYTLGDIASVDASEVADDSQVIALRKIVLGRSPAAGQSVEISGTELVGSLGRAGVDLNKVGYSFPRVIQLSRAGREITMPELRAAIDTLLTRAGKNVVVTGIQSTSKVMVPNTEFELQGNRFWSSGVGKLSFDLTVRGSEIEPTSFNVVADYEEWREVPVAARPLERGAIISEKDIERARMNIANLPKEAAYVEQELIGQEVKGEVGIGEIFRKDRLVLPPMIAAGSAVKVVYKTRLMEASASGIALEAGGAGEEIRVRNDSSKRILKGVVSEPGVVTISPVR